MQFAGFIRWLVLVGVVAESRVEKLTERLTHVFGKDVTIDLGKPEHLSYLDNMGLHPYGYLHGTLPADVSAALEAENKPRWETSGRQKADVMRTARLAIAEAARVTTDELNNTDALVGVDEVLRHESEFANAVVGALDVARQAIEAVDAEDRTATDAAVLAAWRAAYPDGVVPDAVIDACKKDEEPSLEDAIEQAGAVARAEMQVVQ